MTLGIILAIVAIIVIAFIAIYNKLVTARQRVKNGWGQIDVQLQRRFLLRCLPSAEKVTELRTSWANAKTVAEKMEISNQLSDTLKTIMAVSENYPDLKANQNFMSLQEELTNTENKISYSRQFYNDTVTRYNTMLETFPSNLVASMFHFEAEKLFEVDNPSARQNVKVDFNK